MRHTILPVLIMMAVMSALSVATLAGTRLATGDAIPPLHLYDLKGQQVRLESFRGKPVLLHFWATWCQHCRTEMPLLEQTARAHAGKLVVLGVNLAEKRRKVAAYVAESGLTFPILLDPRGNAAEACGVVALPTTLLVDPAGRITGEIPMGSMTREDLEQKLAPFL